MPLQKTLILWIVRLALSIGIKENILLNLEHLEIQDVIH